MLLSERKSSPMFLSGREKHRYDMPNSLKLRRKETTDRLDHFRGSLAKAARFVEKKACVYVTGSFYAPVRATKHSDLDLFILGRTD